MLRLATDSDYLAIWSIYMDPDANSFMDYGQMDPESFKPIYDMLNSDGHFYVYEITNQVVSICRLVCFTGCYRHIAYIGSVATLAAKRKHGYASKMLVALLNIISETMPQIERVELFVEEDNPKALALYQKLGFEFDAIYPNWFKRSTDILHAKPVASLLLARLKHAERSSTYPLEQNHIKLNDKIKSITRSNFILKNKKWHELNTLTKIQSTTRFILSKLAIKTYSKNAQLYLDTILPIKKVQLLQFTTNRNYYFPSYKLFVLYGDAQVFATAFIKTFANERLSGDRVIDLLEIKENQLPFAPYIIKSLVNILLNKNCSTIIVKLFECETELYNACLAAGFCFTGIIKNAVFCPVAKKYHNKVVLAFTV